MSMQMTSRKGTLFSACFSMMLSMLITSLGYMPQPVSASQAVPIYLNIDRYGHSATAMQEGEVLIAGGKTIDGSSTVLNNVEIVSTNEQQSGSNRSIPGASLQTARTDHAATPLAASSDTVTRILVTGGSGSSGTSLRSTEIYDVQIDSWSAGADLKVARTGHTATRLSNGQVLIVGGDACIDDHPCGTAEIYGSSITIGALNTPRSKHSAILLKDGRVLIVGGVDKDGNALRSAELYNPASASFSMVSSSMQVARIKPDLRLLPDEKVQIIGGALDRSFEIYEPIATNVKPGFNAKGQPLNASTTIEDVLEAQIRAALIFTDSVPLSDSFSDLLNRDGYAMTEIVQPLIGNIRQPNKVLISGGLGGNAAGHNPAYLADGSPAVITTDQTDYAPGRDVLVTATGFAPHEGITISWLKVKEGQDPQYSTPFTWYADEEGMLDKMKIYSPVRPDDLDATFTLTAVGQITGFIAQTSFTDADIGLYDQCSNDDGDGYATGDTGCRWTDGNLQKNNSTYFEHDATVQRVWLTGYTPNSSHTITLKYATTKSGKHAYDFLTTWNHSENWLTEDDRCQNITGCVGLTESTLDIPVDPNANGYDSAVGSRQFVMRGGTLNSATVPTIASGTYAGDSETVLTVSFTVAGSGNMCHIVKEETVCDVALWFGAHVASAQNWGIGSGASSISGSPYHVALDTVDSESVGQRDNQMQSGAVIPNGTIVIIKDAGDLGGQQAFNFSLTGFSNFQLFDDGVSNTNTATFSVPPGSYSTSEINLATAWQFIGVSCTESGGTNDTSVSNQTKTATINLQSGETVTCTFQNGLRALPRLTLIKTVTNDDGGTAAPEDFKLFASDGASQQFQGDGGFGPLSVDPATFTLSENTLPGYTAGSWSCTGTGSFNGTDQITLDFDQSAVCTINNDDQPAHLKLVKIVTNNNGGTAQVTDFTLSANGPTPLSGAGGVESDVDAGTYDLSETGPSGYTAGSWSCVGGTQNGSQIQLALGQSATCTINNNDQTAHLKLIKHVINNNGGTAQETDFTLSANGPTPISGAGGVENDVDAGTYTLSETELAGYTAGEWSCSGGTQNGNQIQLALGQSATCEITNDDQTAHLTLVKVVVNDSGGTAVVNDFILSANGPTPISGAGGADSNVSAGTYTLSETNVTGYTASNWNCVGGRQIGDQIQLRLGESATCTITNDDQSAHLKLLKVVDNNNGGTAQVTDFTLSASGPTPLSGAGGAESDVDAGTYDLSETGLSGYTAGSWSCVGGTQNGSQVQLGLGQSATCTIHNDDQTAHLKLVKVVVNDNGGTAVANNFTLSANGPTPISGAGGVENDVDAGTYTLSETELAGYTAGEWSCSGGTQNGNQVQLALGQSATCTITNNDQPAHLTLVKTVTNNNGGTAEADDFTLSAAGPTPISGAGGAESDVDAGNYTLSETTLPGYTAGSWSCTGGNFDDVNHIALAVGQSATCTINNDDQPGTIIIKKITKPANTGSFAFIATGQAYNGFTLSGGEQNSQQLNAGTYTVHEETQLGWILTGIGGSSNPATPYDCTVTGSNGSTGSGNLNTQTATIHLNIGDTVTCVFENTGEGVTRTQGFWATHPQLAEIAWFGGTAFGHTFPGVANVPGINDKLICGRPIDDYMGNDSGLGKLMGSFWSDVAKKSTGAKRAALDQARMQLLQQLIAAELNISAFGSVPSGGSGKFAQWEGALCGTNTTAIKNAQQQAASFNTQGDSGTFTPGTSADSKYARSIANIPFWDIIKP